MITGFLPERTYRILFSLLAVVYILGLFVPLMDNDSAHHANIALNMHLTGNYVDLVDYGTDYLDKPHLHFWLAAFSYKIFGVTGFAYKFPSFLFTILGTYSTYRLGLALYNREVGKLSALIVASAFAYILANNDVRMDAILTASISFATWQLVEFIQNKKLVNVAGAALGLALGFSCKGHIAVFVPAVAALCYIFYRKEWKLFINWKWLLLILLFGVFIFPVVYCYYLQFNLHPEKIVRGQDHVNGVKFILLNQSVERFRGDAFGADSKHDYLFFIHSFLWAFAPWSALGYWAIFERIKNLKQRHEEWLTAGVFIIILLVVSFSGFKLPHYLNIVFPTTAVLVAAFIIGKKEDARTAKIIFTLQLISTLLIFIAVGILTFWAFPVKKLYVIAGVVIFLALYFYFLRSERFTRIQKACTISVAAMILAFYILNTNFYPQLLKYQGGNEMAFAIKNKVDPANVYFWKDTYSSSFNFYTATVRKVITDSGNTSGKRWLLYDIKNEEAIKQAGYILGEKYIVPDYEITRLDLRFINPSSREAQCTQLVLSELK